MEDLQQKDLIVATALLSSSKMLDGVTSGQLVVVGELIEKNS
ncbi:hypothetical protein SDC9_207278 [bioreactor metagenome]|uniref:Uncharacterized protein n=1 Tax=bioreactor metagenome TaxID=1076179 RepID=A0A645J832_9ZZZZ